MLLKKNTQNSLVKRLQAKLVELGYTVGPVDGFFGPKTEDAVLKYQRDKGLSIDGIVGDETWTSLFGEAIPRLRDELVEPPYYSQCFDVFGDFRIEGWKPQNLARCDLSTFRSELERVYFGWLTPEDRAFVHSNWFGFVCHRLVVPKFQDAFKNVVDGGLEEQLKTFDGCYAVRYIRGGDIWSTHSWAIAIDLNARWNRFGQDNFEMTPEFAQCFKDAGFIWGGEWQKPDAMHFQYCTTR